MDKISLIVEGKEDKRFLEDFIKAEFPSHISRIEFIVVGGNASKLHTKETTIQSASEKNVSILIFDADDSYSATLSIVNQQITKLGVREAFLFPDNKSGGKLETLLQSIAVHTSILECIDSYVDCIRGNGIKGLIKFTDKTKFFVYADSFEKKAKGSERDYFNSLWDLSSLNLAPLKSFLGKYLQ
jgi:hypothetical protein